MNQTHELIISVVNRGFSEVVMDAARSKGAQGGTILHGKGSLSPTVQKFFNLTLHEDKEVVLIVVNKDIRNEVVNALLETVGLTKEAQGITFTLPVEEFVLLTKPTAASLSEKKSKQETEKVEAPKADDSKKPKQDTQPNTDKKTAE